MLCSPMVTSSPITACGCTCVPSPITVLSPIYAKAPIYTSLPIFAVGEMKANESIPVFFVLEAS